MFISSIDLSVNCQNIINVSLSILFEICSRFFDSSSFKEKLISFFPKILKFLIKYKISKKSFKNILGSTP